MIDAEILVAHMKTKEFKMIDKEILICHIENRWLTYDSEPVGRENLRFLFNGCRTFCVMHGNEELYKGQNETVACDIYNKRLKKGE